MKAPGPGGRLLIPLDQEPIRRSASGACLRAFESAERLKSQVRQYEEIDLPAYARWLRESFSGLMDRTREAAEKVADLERLINSVEAVVDYLGCDHATAYGIVMEEKRADAKEEGQGGFDPGEEFGGSDRTSRDSLGEEDLRRAFEELFGFGKSTEETLETDFGDQREEEEFQEFKRFFTGEASGRGRRQDASRPDGSRNDGMHQRIKERYRKLARLLHPDLSDACEGVIESSRRKELWLQVQEAYGAGDLVRLDQLLLLAALIGKGSVVPGAVSATISETLALAARLRETLRPLKRQIREMRRSPAWGFTNVKDPGERDTLRERSERELREDLESFEGRLDFLKRKVRSWDRNARLPGSVRRQARGASRVGRGRVRGKRAGA